MDTKLEELKKALGEQRVRAQEPMTLRTAFKAGGPAQYYIDVNTIDELIHAVSTARSLGLQVFIFGTGTSLIVSKNGIPGLVIKNNCRKFELTGVTGRIKNQQLGVDKAHVYAETGVIMNQLVRYTIDQGLCGLEYQLGLPGTVGGALYNNSGLPHKNAFVGNAIYRARILKEDGSIEEVDHTYFQFGYDRSFLHISKDIVLSVTFKLEKEDSSELWKKATEVLTYRTQTQPKDNAGGYTYRTMGIDGHVPIPDRMTSAAAAIKRVGMAGKKIGPVMLSKIEPNYIMNVNFAKGEDVSELLKIVKDSVFDKLRLQLHIEARMVGGKV